MYKTITEYLKLSEKKENYEGTGRISSTTNEYSNTTDPKVWGPPFWFTLHVSAAHYPEQASTLVRDRMKARILAIPFELPCVDCRTHASNYILSHVDHLNDICSSRESLFKFYVDFHNKVNERYNKPSMSYEQAKNLYYKGIKITSIKYG